MNFLKLLSPIICCLIFLWKALPAQTTSIVYSENFDSGPGGWIIGGYNPSWKHGIPSLPNITAASNCFVTGDAGAASTEPFAACTAVSGPTTTGNYYNCCERSFVESPSVDLTFVGSPQLSLDINLFCEQTYDGAKVQMSLDGGVTWIDIGQYTGSAYGTFPSELNCREQNWYNKNVISYLDGTAGGCSAVTTFFMGSSSGWSGGCSQISSGACGGPDSHGTNGWITASHCIPAAAYQPDVKIRIAFGAGSQVYADGLAFDNVVITDSYPIAGFTHSSSGACDAGILFNNFTDCAASYTWDFGHPGFPGNISLVLNPDHMFPTAGTYNVTLTATDFCGGSSSETQSVIVNFPSPPQINNIVVTEPLLCDSSSGSVTIQLGNSGTSPYEIGYNFNNVPQSIPGLIGNPVTLQGMFPGNYSAFTITDAIGCIGDSDTSFVIPYITDSLFITAYPDTVVLPGNSVTLHANSNIPSVFSWSPAESLDNPNSQDPIATPESSTIYTVTAVDSNGCVATSEVSIIVDKTQPCTQYYFPNSFTPNHDHKNETFGVTISPLLDLAKFNMNIYDRWGRTMFSSDNPLQVWDGANCPVGIYTVLAEFTCGNRKSSKYSGVLNLIR